MTALHGRLQQAMHLLKTHGTFRLAGKIAVMLQTQGLVASFRFCKRKLAQELSYDAWIAANDTLTDTDRSFIRKAIAALPHKPLISVVMPVYNVEEIWLRAAIDSVFAQLYPCWELCIADDASSLPHIRQVLEEYQAKDARVKCVFRPQNGHISEASNSALTLATGEYIALLDHDDELSGNALYEVACAINQHPDIDLLYSDEDKISTSGKRFSPYFKPDWNPELFYTQNMFCHLGVYRRSLVEKLGGFRKGYEGSQDYDLTLRALLATDATRIRHIPKILYHWRAIEGSTAQGLGAKHYAADASRRAVQEYMQTAYPTIQVSVADAEGVAQTKGYHRLVWSVPSPAPKVTVLIPTRNGYGLLKQCVESIIAKTTYPQYEIVILNNQSNDAGTLSYFTELGTQQRIKILDYDHPFNFSAINNFGVAHTDGNVLCFLNNDMEVITPGWLEEMVGNALRPEIGAVGAKLYYPNNTIQHGGIILGVGMYDMPVAGHAFHHLPRHDPGYFMRAALAQNISAVTAACMVVRREAFLKVGGFDEQHLKIAFNDVDLCLKLIEHGYRNLWTPYAGLYHYESASRGKEDTLEKAGRFLEERAYMRKRWGEMLDHDPYYNPNLNRYRGDFSLG